MSRQRFSVDAVVFLAATALVPVAVIGLLPFSVLEALGFATGAISVWLVVRASVWTWPVGIANNLVFVVLFFDARLYADMALQFVYVALSLGGWWYWLRGDAGKPRAITRVASVEALFVAVSTAGATAGLTVYLKTVHDSAPFLDALTTSLSIAATYLMARKLLESWVVWIAADLIYIPLYAWKALPLTAVLYGVFLAMCMRGIVAWRRALKPFRHAVVAGKFYPFHAGHKYLISEAMRESEDVSVLVCGADEQKIPAAVRADWIRKTFPSADVVVVDQTALGLADDDSEGWAAATVAALRRRPDAVFSSETYGDAYAVAMGAVHRMVDRERKAVPISGTAIRRDPLAHLDRLEPHVRAHYVKRVCIVGAESTGKTTLAQKLAEAFDTIWVPEYGREYCERFGKQLGDEWRTDEFLHIAEVQAAREDLFAERANRVLICDTDLLTTALFHHAYTGLRDERLEQLAAERSYDLYLLCGLGVPFVQDGWRTDGPHRARMDAELHRHLAESGASFVELTGPYGARYSQAARAVEDLRLGGLRAAG
jgi:NadR type nicotinamide-nucleotide adenylyltransferase